MKKKHLLILTLTLASLGYTNAQVRLPKLISNGMVLQRDVKLKIWGWASPGEQVSLMISSEKDEPYQTKANDKGEWSITLKKQKAGGPYYMKILASNQLVIEDILFGDVWLCSGQSNMELGMNRVKYKYPDEIENANNDQIRQFLVPDKYDFKQAKQDLDGGSWLPVTRKNIMEFSAVGYFFAKELYAKYQVPIGLINSALGGSPAESWISEEELKKFPKYYDELQKFKNDDMIRDIEAKDRNNNSNWNRELNSTDLGLAQGWKDPSFDDQAWTENNLIGISKINLPIGATWFRKTVDVPASMVDKPAKIELGTLSNSDSVFINGKYVGNTTYQYPPRRYEFAPGILKEGKNTIVIRLVTNNDKGGFTMGKRYELTTKEDTIDLYGKWKYYTGTVVPAPEGSTTVRFKPGGLYNAMISPLINYAIKGAIWYQGESNAGRPKDYKSLMETLINDWRNKWKDEDFPFIIVQLPNYMAVKTEPGESGWAELRQQQLNTLSVPNTALAVTIDLGEWNELHPENKKDVAHRVALQAMKLAYDDKKVIPSGPLYQSMRVEGEKIIINFSNAGSGLMAKPGAYSTNANPELKYFAIAGPDKKFVWAKAIIENNSVVVWYDEIKNPVYVRYAWADNPAGANLYNKEGLPASPFEAGKN